MSALPYKPKPGEIPTNPGVYRFLDIDGRVLYVGKAKNLRARLSNYFAPLHTLHDRTRRMVTTAASVEWTVVDSDVIVVMDHGRVVGQGTHSELVQTVPLYRDLAKHQLLV